MPIEEKIVKKRKVGRHDGIFQRVKTIYKPPFSEEEKKRLIKEGKIKKKYDWLVLARKAVAFPTREYDVPLEGKIPYDFRMIEPFAKVLNSEIEGREAVEIAKQQIDEHHQFLAKQDVDKIIEMKNAFSIGDVVYLHAPIWFIAYEYKGERYNIILDGATGTVVKGDIPSTKFGLF